MEASAAVLITYDLMLESGKKHCAELRIEALAVKRVISGCYYQRVSPLALSMLLLVVLITIWGMDRLVQALTDCLPVLVLLRSPIWKEGSKQRIGIPHSFSSLGMVQDQELNTLVLHAHILLHVWVMGIFCIFCCFQDSIVWVTIHTFRVYWSYGIGGYSGRTEHPNTLPVRTSKMDEWRRTMRHWFCIRLHAYQCCPHGDLQFEGLDDDDITQALQGEDQGKKQSQVVAEDKKEGENRKKRERGENSNDDLHVWTERERRKKMKNMFSILHSFLPNVPPKADKVAVIEEAANYIKSLEDTVHGLEKQKLERIQGSKSLVSIAGSSTQAMLPTREAFVADHVSATNQNNAALPTMDRTDRRSSNICLVPTTIQTWGSPNVGLNVFGDDAQFVIYAPKKPGLFANICSVLDTHRLEALFVHISSDVGRCIYMIQARVANRGVDELQEASTVEERYKHAAREIMAWVSS